MNAGLPSVLARALAPMAPPQSVVHQIVKPEPLPAIDGLSPELDREFDRIFRRDMGRQAQADKHWFPGSPV